MGGTRCGASPVDAAGEGGMRMAALPGVIIVPACVFGACVLLGGLDFFVEKNIMPPEL